MTPAETVELVLLTLMIVTAVAAVSSRSLLTASMLLSIFSLLIAAVWVGLHAPDVAFTEAVVGAGVSTVFLLATLARTGWRERPVPGVHWPALAICILVASGLVLGIADLPLIGDPTSPANTGVGAWYLAHCMEQTQVPNVVTAVLASYRGYDTMFETAVVFTAGAAVLLLLNRQRSEDAGEGAA